MLWTPAQTAWYWNVIMTGLLAALWYRRLAVCSLFLIVWVREPSAILSCKPWFQICRRLPTVVLYCTLGRGLFLTFPLKCNLAFSLQVVPWLTPNDAAARSCRTPAWSCSMAIQTSQSWYAWSNTPIDHFSKVYAHRWWKPGALLSAPQYRKLKVVFSWVQPTYWTPKKYFLYKCGTI